MRNQKNHAKGCDPIGHNIVNGDVKGRDMDGCERINHGKDKEISDSRGRVTIFIPTYKNKLLILACVNSCLKQTYANIEVVVIDNGFNELGEILKTDLEKFNDERVLYRPNPSNIGMQGNFWLILSLAQYTRRFIVIPADCLLATDCIEKMMSAMEKNPSVNMVYPRTLSRNIKNTELTAKTNPDDKPLPWPYMNYGPMSSLKIVKLFYSFHNIDSEWSHFSFIGSLIDGSVLRSISMMRYPMLDHGCEELISLTLLSFSDDVVILSDPLLIHYTNAVRLGSAVRPGFNYTRYEPLRAEYYYLEIYEPLLIRRGVPLSKLYFFLIIKTVYSIFRYPGPVYLLMPKAIAACLKLFLFIIPFEVSKYIKEHS